MRLIWFGALCSNVVHWRGQPLWKSESLEEVVIELMWYLEDVCLLVKGLLNDEKSENVYVSLVLLDVAC